jgi:hypothetical protein
MRGDQRHPSRGADPRDIHSSIAHNRGLWNDAGRSISGDLCVESDEHVCAVMVTLSAAELMVFGVRALCAA